VPWFVYSGVPAKKIKNRRRNILELEKEYLAEQLNDSGTDAGEKNY
jgi:galactoside O-acetyltransferase